MANAKKLIALLTCLMLLLNMVACVAPEDSTPPTTAPQQTTALMPPETEEIQPEETNVPTETEPQLQSREPEGTPMTARQLHRLHWQLAEDSEGWYKALLADTFIDPKELNVFRAFGNGTPNRAPGEERTELTPEEQQMINEARGSDSSDLETARIPRETVERVLLTYLELNPEDVAAMDFGPEVIYWEETDCYYIVQNSYGYIIPYFHEGYTMPDGTIVIYYCDALSTPQFYRAVLRLGNDGIYKILEITDAELNFVE